MDKVEFNVGGKSISIETGRIAKQSSGSALVTSGESAVLVTVNSAKPREGIDFFPLTVDYIEKVYAAGRIPGGFFKREGRLTEKEILTSRFIDRSLRPLFADGYRDETQVTATVLSADPNYDTDMLGFIGASAAVSLADVPFPNPIGAVRVSRVDGQLIANPSFEEVDNADLTIIVAGKHDAIVMVEGGALQVSEADVLSALRFGHEQIQTIIKAQQDLVGRAGKPTREVTVSVIDADLRAKVEAIASDQTKGALQIQDKIQRYKKLGEIKKSVVNDLVSSKRAEPQSFGSLEAVEDAQAKLRQFTGDVKQVIEDIKAGQMRGQILNEGRRIDGRGLKDIRPITCEVGVFPRVHGNSLFTRGETQAIASVTLGSSRDEQMIEGLKDTFYRSFYLHYNFPPFSVGEVKPLRGPNRRETGHGALAERAVKSVLPETEESPYTIRIVSEVTESNGSSSMATVCGSTLALMDAGVKIKAPVAGIAMGLITENGKNAILSDILGDEDHLGDMDFKVAGSREGITAIQMDIKIDGLEWAVVEAALEQAREGRLHILSRMEEETKDVLPGFVAREEVNDNAPRVSVFWIKPDRIRDVIGPGGKVIRSIQEVTGAKIDIEDSGRVIIFGNDRDSLERCEAMVKEITQEAEVGKLYLGKVKKVTDFGAFVEIFPGTDGLLHISELADGRVAKVEDICVEGDEVMVKCLDVDPSGKIRLSRRAALEEGVEASQ